MAGHRRRHAGVVHQHIDSTELGIDHIHQALHFRPLAHMAGYGQRAPAQRPYLLSHGFAGVQLSAGDDQVGTPLGKCLDHLVAQPSAAPGDQNDLATEVEQLVAHLYSPRMSA
ncbi:hypothetical protein FQZ97_1207620 [compost metagenome]